MAEPSPAPAAPGPASALARPTVVAVSLKMYFGPARTLQWCREVLRTAAVHPGVESGAVELVVLPSVTVVGRVAELFADTPVRVGVQDLYFEDRGPFTGAVSGADLRELGCSVVEVGHVERRRLFGETDEQVHRKVAAAWRNELTPLVCVGESLPGRPDDAATECIRQLSAALVGLQPPAVPAPVVVAYEPVWAIGVEEPASVEHVAAVTARLRAWLDERPSLAGAPVIYGGSAREGLASQLGDATSGLFLGRYAHDAAAVVAILDETDRLR